MTVCRAVVTGTNPPTNKKSKKMTGTALLRLVPSLKREVTEICYRRPNSERTAVFAHCCRGAAGLAEQVVKLLVGVYGAELTVRAGNGSTPLHWAASKGKRAVIEVIAGNFCAQVCERGVFFLPRRGFVRIGDCLTACSVGSTAVNSHGGALMLMLMVAVLVIWGTHLC